MVKSSIVDGSRRMHACCEVAKKNAARMIVPRHFDRVANYECMRAIEKASVTQPVVPSIVRSGSAHGAKPFAAGVSNLCWLRWKRFVSP